MIWFNGFPFLDNKEDHSFGVPVSQVMTSHVTTIPASGLDIQEVEKILIESAVQGFPIIESIDSKTLIGYIGRTELQYAINRCRRDTYIPPHVACIFSTTSSSTAIATPITPAPTIIFGTRHTGPFSSSGSNEQHPMTIDFSKFVDFTPLSVHPRLPLETVMELFKKMGPRVILIEYRGTLTGLVTVKDCLKYQFTAEAHENPRDDAVVLQNQERLWGVLKKAAAWVAMKVKGWTKGRIVLGDEADHGTMGRNGDVVDARGPDGLAVADPGLELEERFPLGGTGGS